ncbi:MAG: hypothetical protein EOP35_13700 [Rubrivivax sp.]|nr:MAG: hypothetical protein EOP35_13700 [Rubrivivax sp.]
MNASPVSRLGASVLLAVGCASSALARAEELPKSPACRTALQALNSAEESIAAAGPTAAASSPSTDLQRQRVVTAKLQPLRQRVADACLGGLTQSPPPSQRTWVAPALPARPGTVAPRAPQPTVPPVALPAPRVEVPVTVNACNAATCLASDGSTLTRVGPTLMGPRGACRQEGVFLRCP